MKILALSVPHLTAATVLASLALIAPGCAKSDRTDVRARVKDAYEETKTAMADAWKDAKSYTFEKRRDFSSRAESLKSTMDAQVDQMRANYSDARASASRKAAMDELKKAQGEFKAKVDALGRATADTWDSAKHNVVVAWDRLQAAYRNARED